MPTDYRQGDPVTVSGDYPGHLRGASGVISQNDRGAEGVYFVKFDEPVPNGHGFTISGEIEAEFLIRL